MFPKALQSHKRDSILHKVLANFQLIFLTGLPMLQSRSKAVVLEVPEITVVFKFLKFVIRKKAY